MKSDDLLLADEVADLYRTNVKTLATWRSKGEGPQWIKLGKRVVYRRTDVEAYLEKCAAESAIAARERRGG